MFNFQEIFKCAFKIYGIWLQAQSVVYIHTHLRNEVPLVWGSLSLAPTTCHIAASISVVLVRMVSDECNMVSDSCCFFMFEL